MSVGTRNKLLAGAVTVALGIAAMVIVGQGRQSHPTVTVEASPSVSVDVPAAPESEIEPDRPADNQKIHVLPVPLTFRGPEGALVVALDTNFDAVDAHCARKLLALIARENAPGWERYRDDRHGAAVRACPGMVRR